MGAFKYLGKIFDEKGNSNELILFPMMRSAKVFNKVETSE